MRLEHEYERCGAWAYLAALDIHRAKVFGRCERKSGIAPFERLVDPLCDSRPTTTPAGSSGSWTMAPRIVKALRAILLFFSCP